MKRPSGEHSGYDMDANDLIQAISFAHYAERFRDKLFVIGLTRNTSIRDLLLDFKVLAAYGIRVVLLAPDSDLDKPIELSNTHGTRFRLFPAEKLEDVDGKARLLPVDENDIAADIGGFWLCEVDDQLVAVMRLKRYGTWAELGAATSLSRERGRRHSGALVVRLLDEAKKEGLAAVFVLGKDTRMASTFGALGFEEIDRSELPAQWKEHYDMSRPTRAFVKYVG